MATAKSAQPNKMDVGSTDLDGGVFAQNVIYFVRVLRDAGIRIGTASALDAINAVKTGGIGSRDDFYWTLHSILINRREDHAVFDEAFNLFWRSRDLVEKMIAMFSPMVTPDQNEEPQKPKAAQSRVSQSLFSGKERDERVELPEIEVDAKFTVSGKELLRSKDFAQMSADEVLTAQQAIAELSLPRDWVVTRRYRPGKRGNLIDPRATLRHSLKTGGDLLTPKFRERRKVHPPLVVIADISGSMSQYTRIFLHFLHALSEKRRHVHVFLFGTRLTNVTRALKSKDPDEALAEVSQLVEDWEGGTRIGETLHQFNRDWSRRVLGQNATALLITDGLERDSEGGLEQLSKEMERLGKSCRRLIWLNPLLRFDGFEAKASGVRTMLPHVDEFRAVHNVNAMADLCRALSGKDDASINPRVLLRVVERG